MKITTSLIAFGLLGAVGFACTIGSGTDDSDGGSTTSSGGLSSSSSSSSGASTTDAGDGGGSADLCPAFTDKAAVFQDPTCNTCVLTNCCAETAGCFNIASDATHSSCLQYQECLASDCDDKTAEDPNVCKKSCKDLTFAEVPPQYDKWLACVSNQCETACTNQDPDGGTN